MLDTKTYTVAHFVADFYGIEETLDYSNISDGWDQWVNNLADFGGLLEDVVQEAIKAGGQIAEWYDILEGCTAELHAYLSANKEFPDADQMRPKFAEIVALHLEK